MVRQNSNSTKDYIYIEDALEGILRSGILSAADDVYNICSGSSYSVQDWAEFLNSSIESVSDSPILYSRVSTRKAQEKLGFRVKQNLKNLRLADIVNSGT
jgi:nucleoside-diphosphate-sugar epimerase